MLEPVAAAGALFEAWTDESQVQDGAAARASLLCFGQKAAIAPVLEGLLVDRVNAVLTGAWPEDIGTDDALERSLALNQERCVIPLLSVVPIEVETG